MVARKHEVTIFVSDAYLPKHRALLPDGLRVEYLSTRARFPFSPAFAPFTPSLRRKVQEMDLDVLQAEEIFQTGTLLGWLASGRGIPFFVWQELDIIMRGAAGRMQKVFYSTLGKRISETSAAVIPRSISAGNHLAEYDLGRRTEEVVHSGVDTAVFEPLSREACRAELGLSEYDNVLLSVGRVHPNKGFDRGIEAMAQISESLNACLVIKGQGPQLGELRLQAKKLGNRGQDNLPNGISRNVRDGQALQFRRCSAGQQPRRPFPFTAIEAISCGVPVLTSFERGLKTDIVERGAGLLLQESPGMMAEGISESLADKDRLSSIGKKGRALAIEEFDFEVMAERFLRIYRRHEL